MYLTPVARWRWESQEAFGKPIADKSQVESPSACNPDLALTGSGPFPGSSRNFRPRSVSRESGNATGYYFPFLWLASLRRHMRINPRHQARFWLRGFSSSASARPGECRGVTLCAGSVLWQVLGMNPSLTDYSIQSPHDVQPIARA